MQRIDEHEIILMCCSFMPKILINELNNPIICMKDAYLLIAPCLYFEVLMFMSYYDSAKFCVFLRWL